MYEAERQRREIWCTKRSAKGAKYDVRSGAPKARNMIARGKREARRPW